MYVTLKALKWQYANVAGQRLLHAEVIVETLVMWVSLFILPSALRAMYISYFILSTKSFQEKLYAKFFISQGFLFDSPVTKAN